MTSMDPFDTLIHESKLFKSYLAKIKIGAKSYEKSIPLEEKIIHLKQTTNIVEAKVNAIYSNIFETNSESNRQQSEEHIKETKNELLDKIIYRKLEDKLCKTVSFSKKFEDLTSTNYPKDPEHKLYKEKIMKQLRIMKVNNEAILKLVWKQNMLLEEKLDVQTEIKEIQLEFQKYLTEQQEKLQEERNKNLNPEYLAKEEMLKKRIDKLNFMRVITMRLLTFSKLPWEQISDYIPILEKMRTPCTIEMFKNN